MENTKTVYYIIRVANSLTTKEIAGKLLIYKSTVLSIECGKKKPSRKIKTKYAKLVNISTKLLDELDEKVLSGNYTFEEVLFIILENILKTQQNEGY